MYDLMIIGAGASGLLAAALAAEDGAKVLILERNNAPAKKIYATGNGRCNYLNERAEGFEAVRKVLEGIGIFGVCEEDGRYYPRSREASAVAKALIRAAEKSGAKIICDCHVTDVMKTEKGFTAVSKDGRKFEAEKLLIATGGKAGIQFGCYGEGYRWAQFLGHSLVKPVPALVPIQTEEDISSLHGVRVRGKVSLLCGGEPLMREEGEIQFTKDAVSGICVMDLSGKVRFGEGLNYELSLDLFPGTGEEELERLLSRQKEITGRALEGLVPEKLASYLEKRAEGNSLAALCRDLRFRVKGTGGWADAQVSSGGVPLSEIDGNTMGSKLVPGLFFAGEITDYDGPCGGFNLTNAFRTAIIAAGALKGDK